MAVVQVAMVSALFGEWGVGLHNPILRGEQSLAEPMEWTGLGQTSQKDLALLARTQDSCHKRSSLGTA